MRSRWLNTPTTPTPITPHPTREREPEPAATPSSVASVVIAPTTRVTHFVCSTPGRFGPMSRSGAAVVRLQRLAVDLQGQQRVAIGDLALRSTTDWL